MLGPCRYCAQAEFVYFLIITNIESVPPSCVLIRPSCTNPSRYLLICLFLHVDFTLNSQYFTILSYFILLFQALFSPKTTHTLYNFATISIFLFVLTRAPIVTLNLYYCILLPRPKNFNHSWSVATLTFSIRTVKRR